MQSVSAFSLIVSFTEQKFFILMNSTYILLLSLPSFRSSSVSPMFSSKSFKESIKVNFWIRCFHFVHMDARCFQHHLLRKLSIFHWIAYVPCQKSMAIFVWLSLGTLYSVHLPMLYVMCVTTYLVNVALWKKIFVWNKKQTSNAWTPLAAHSPLTLGRHQQGTCQLWSIHIQVKQENSHPDW